MWPNNGSANFSMKMSGSKRSKFTKVPGLDIIWIIQCNYVMWAYLYLYRRHTSMAFPKGRAAYWANRIAARLHCLCCSNRRRSSTTNPTNWILVIDSYGICSLHDNVRVGSHDSMVRWTNEKQLYDRSVDWWTVTPINALCLLTDWTLQNGNALKWNRLLYIMTIFVML